MTPEEGFESSQWLVGWANAQLSELEKVLESFDQGGPATVVKEFNNKTRFYEVKIRTRPLPYKVRGFTNDVVKNLRDALDQATSAATHYIVGTERKNAHFPFATSPDDFDRAVTLNQCKHIPPELYGVLKGYEPYPTGEGWTGGNNALRLLGRVSGPHKHRLSLSQAVTSNSMSISGSHISSGSSDAILFPHGTVAKNNEIFVLRLGEDGNAKFDLHYSMCVAFADTKVKGLPVLDFLQACSASVGEIVQDLQAQAVRLGPRA